MDNEELKRSFADEDRFKHCEEILFITKDWILFDVMDICDSSAGCLAENITYKQVFACINWMEQNPMVFRSIKVQISHEHSHIFKEDFLL